MQIRENTTKATLRKRKDFSDHKYSASLSQDLFNVVSDRAKYYGGSQYLYAKERDRTSGCGIAGAADVLLYLKLRESGASSVSVQQFLEVSRDIRKFIPIIPGRGVNAFLLASGLNRYFKKNGIELKARWKLSCFKKWETLVKMLKDNIPVILAIGNNFPFVWGKKKLNLYVEDHGNRDTEEPVYRKDQSVYGHFVVVTKIEDNCLTVSSWGRKFFINIDEYNRYVLRHSTHLYSNILVIK